MKKTPHIIFFLFVVLYLFNRLFHHPVYDKTFIRCYLSDFLCLPIVLFFILLIFRHLLFNSNKYTLPVIYIIIAFLCFSFSFEWLLPKYDSRFTCDMGDVIAYFTGGVFFYLFLNLPMQSQK